MKSAWWMMLLTDALLVAGVITMAISAIFTRDRAFPWAYSTKSKRVFFVGLGFYAASQVSDVAYRLFCSVTELCDLRVDLNGAAFRMILLGVGTVALLASAALTGGRAFPWMYSSASKRVFWFGLGFCLAGQLSGALCRLFPVPGLAVCGRLF